MNTKAADILRAERHLLWKPPQWDWIPFDKKIACYNGVGADHFPVAVRWLLTLVNPLFLPAVVIHDFDYTYYRRGYWGFTFSNFRLGVNLTLCFFLCVTPLVESLARPFKNYRLSGDLPTLWLSRLSSITHKRKESPMPEQFLHGVEVIEIDGGARTVQTVKSSVIGLVGTAPDASPEKFPLNTPVLITHPTEVAGLGVGGTLASAIDGIFDQTGAVIVVIRVEAAQTAEGEDENAKTIANVIGSVDSTTGAYKGLSALIAASSMVKQEPRIIVAPGFSHEEAVGTEMVKIAERLKAVAIVDGPNTTDTAVLEYREKFESRRIFIVDPWAKVFDTETASERVEPASARVAGLLVKSDNERGF